MKKISLHLNENGLVSPSDFKFFNQIDFDILTTYSKNNQLRKKLSRIFDVDQEYINICNGGEDALIMIFTMIKVNYSDYAVFLPKNSWTHYKVLLNYFNISYEEIDCIDKSENEFRFNLATLLDFLGKKKDEKYLLLVNTPSNPLGYKLEDEDFLNIIRNIGKQSFLLLDKSYEGFSDGRFFKQNHSLLNSNKNVIIIHSFSKYFGLAGSRIGFIISNCMDSIYKKYLGTNVLSEKIALEYISNEEYFYEKMLKVERIKENLINVLQNNHEVKVYTTKTNFVLIELLSEYSKKLPEYLLKNRIIVKSFTEEKELQSFIRVSIDNKKKMKKLITKIIEYYD